MHRQTLQLPSIATMHHRAPSFLLLAASTVFLVTCAQHQPQPMAFNARKSCIPRERDALLAFKQGITNDTINLLASWHPESRDCCLWTGVTCSRQTGHVIELDLNSSAFATFFDRYLVGQISPSLLSLEYLEYLDLSNNLLEGANHSIPEFLGSMKNLRHLDLSRMHFSGALPPTLSNLSNLEYLDLSGNQLEVSNNSFPQFLGSMKNLRHLGLSEIYFSGTLPPTLSNLSNLEYLDLSYTSFVGSVPPQLGNLSNLQHLDLSSISTSFRDRIPYSTDISWLTHLHLLEYLDMSSVNLSMVVDWPHKLNTIPSLKVINLNQCLLTSANQSLAHLNLTKLESLDLSSNYFDHPVASCWFWNLTSIKYLYLLETSLHGPLPNALGRMTKLQTLSFINFAYGITTISMAVDLKDLCALKLLYLDGSLSSGNIADLVAKLPRCPSNNLEELHLSGNNLTGILPDMWMNLTSLKYLDLSNNRLTGGIPPGIMSFSSLSSIDLSDNHLTHIVPIGTRNYTGLSSLDLSNNYLTDTKPLGTWNLTVLSSLYLSNNHLLGTIPLGTWNLTTLKDLDLSSNHLIGSIPIAANNFPGLSSLDLSNNHITEILSLQTENYSSLSYLNLSKNHITGPVHLPGKEFPTLTALDLSNNNLTGSIHQVFANNFSSLFHLDISTNQLSGNIPIGIMNFTSLNTLIIHSNQLTGQIQTLPRSLIILDISRNHISGHIPRSACELQNLVVLDLSNNFLEGELPKCFRMPNMAVLLLNNNRFSGKFPIQFQSCSRLAFIDLSWNKFNGPLPLWIGDLVRIQFLQLSHNMFIGDIPVNITNLRYLRHLNLASNNVSGVIPLFLANITAMTNGDSNKEWGHPFSWYIPQLGTFNEVIPVVMKQQELKYGVGIFEIVSIDLSLNLLTGEIPDEITSLNGLLNLNLSWNQLSGRIPEKIGDMQSVESLDLSRNNLFGEIPSSLSELTSLSCLDLSYNNLTGRIPQGRQIDTLFTENPSIYNGNDGLCGAPLRRNCFSNNSPENGNSKISERESELTLFYFGLGSGFVVGLWIVFCSLLFMKTWRNAYFYLFDRVHDKVVVTWGRLALCGLSILEMQSNMGRCCYHTATCNRATNK